MSRSTGCVGIEARGFILAAPIAYRMGAGFVPVRKAGKLPWAVVREEYQLEYGTDKLEIHRDAIHPGERILIIDDVLATGGTAAATGRLVETLGGDIVGLGFLIELDGPRTGAARSGEHRVESHCCGTEVMGTVDRVLPVAAAPGVAVAPVELTPLLAAYRRRHPKAPVATINRAYQVAAEAHRNQLRSSGESYINHPLAVARIVADIGLDEISVAAALLHDAVEDTEITHRRRRARLRRRGRGDRRRRHQARADPVRLARGAAGRHDAQDARGDGDATCGCSSSSSPTGCTTCARSRRCRIEKQQRIAQETLDIYAPLAHRLGMQETEAAARGPRRSPRCTRSASPNSTTSSARAHPSARSTSPRRSPRCAARLAELGIEAEVTGRGKHLWSIYEKMVVKGREFDDIFDLVAIRVIVDSMKDCYAALGCIHGRWRPVVGRFKDYIAMPKFNLYQSLHTTVIGPSGKPIEVQIRTKEMHQRAEWGVAAHWAYKGGAPTPTSTGSTGSSTGRPTSPTRPSSCRA